MGEGERGERIKGRLMMAGRKSMKSDLGAAGMAAVLEKASPEVRHTLTRRFLATDWYAQDTTDDVIRLVAAQLGMGAEEYALQLGRNSAYESAGRLGRTLVGLFGSPQRLARYVPEYWSTLYDSGRVTAGYDESTKLLTLMIRDWKGHSALRCYNPFGSMVELSSRFKEPALVEYKRVSCVSRGDAQCVYQYRYG
ncbi:MAG: hypothetical protein H6718_11440 [Polyangiaceae bacterium]|nr:hypothetical protein [Polyangiaceae bacterium]